MLADEVLKPVPGYESFYLVSSFGRVFSLNYRRTGKTVELAQSSLFDKRRSSSSMYQRAKMYHIDPKCPVAIHRLVALAFIPNPHGLEQVNHIDGDKGNNRAGNLEWVDNTTNQKHAALTGLHKYSVGENHVMAILTEAQALEIKQQLETPYRGQLTDLGKKYGVSKHCIFDIKRGKSWRHIA